MEPTANITLEGLRNITEAIGRIRFLIAIVCRPDTQQEIREMIDSVSPPSLGLIGSPMLGVDVITDDTQAEPYLPFYDREELRSYLARNRGCASPDCKCVGGARWWNASDAAFYCEHCAKKISAQNPNLPGFNDCQFVKI